MIDRNKYFEEVPFKKQERIGQIIWEMKLEYFTSMISKLSSFYDENGYYGFMPSASWDLFPV